MFGATPAASWRKTLLRSRMILALSGKCFRNRCMPAPAAAGSAACSSQPFFSIGYACHLNDHMVQKLPFSYDYAGDRMLPLETSYVRGNCRAKTTSQGWENSVSHYLLIRPGMVTCACFYTRTTETIAYVLSSTAGHRTSMHTDCMLSGTCWHWATCIDISQSLTPAVPPGWIVQSAHCVYSFAARYEYWYYFICTVHVARFLHTCRSANWWNNQHTRVS